MTKDLSMATMVCATHALL